MITDKLLAFADNKALTTTAESDVVEFPKGGDEIARTLNLVVQIDDPKAVTPTNATVAVTLKGAANGSSSSWATIMTFPAVSIADCIAKGKRLVNFAKLPLGLGEYAAFRLSLTCSAELSDAKYSAWLTPSVEA